VKRKDVVFAVLGAFFLTNAVLAEIVGGKLIYVGPESWTLFGQRLGASVGVFLWPVVFVTTDLVNEYFGRGGVRRLTFLTVAMIGYAFFALLVAGAVPAAPFSSVGDAAFEQVFRQSRWIIVGSIAAFAVSQLVDVAIFRAVRAKTGASRIWMRATGSTVVSQIVDSVVVLYVGLAVPLGWDLRQFVVVAVPNYLIKLAIAFAMTPVIYLLHALVARYLGRDEAERIAAAAHESA
jgi:uncharacterized integral membrane protein (TIGR00697 family)